jgi:hypothetical protein
LKSNLTTLQDSTSAISSPGSVAGLSPCGGQDSKALPESGPAPVRVSRFRALESDRDTQTSATFGPLFTRSSPSGDLQRCLESRLRARMDVNGSPEFALTWKDWDMPAGEPICALRASERRTGDKGCSGWPTPMAGTKATEDYNEAGNTDSGRRTVELCGWATPTVRDLRNSGGDGKNPRCLVRQSALASWPTPDTLTAQAGQGATSCPAATGKRGVLRPGHSRWLMGYPAAWDSCGATAMQSCRKSRRSS